MNGTQNDSNRHPATPFNNSFDSALSLFHAAKYSQALKKFSQAVVASHTKEQFLMAHLYRTWCAFRQAPFSSSCDQYVTKINISLDSGLPEVEQVRLRLICEVLRYSKYQQWCFDAHQRLWGKYGVAQDGIHLLDLLGNNKDWPASRELIDKLEAKMESESLSVKTKFLYAKYRIFNKTSDKKNIKKVLVSLTDVLGETPDWIAQELNRLDETPGKKDIFYEILKGNRDALSSLDFLNKEKVTPTQAMADISAAVVFSDRKTLNDKVNYYIESLPVRYSAPVLKFAMAYLPKEKFEDITIPHAYGFIDIALLQCKTRQEFLLWLDKCPPNPQGVNAEMVSMIRNSAHYLGGDNLVSFHGESSIFRYKSNKVLVIGFSGLHGDMFLPLSTFSYYFESRDDISQLWLNDVTASNFANGIPGFGNNVIEMASKIKEIIKRHDFEKVVCIGVSAGGSAAAFFAWHLHLDEVIGFSIPTYIDVKNIGRNPSDLYQSFADRGIDLSIDLRNFYKKDSSPKMTLYYGDQNEVDVQYAENMNGLPTVQLRALAGEASHNTLTPLIKSGEFQEIIASL